MAYGDLSNLLLCSKTCLLAVHRAEDRCCASCTEAPPACQLDSLQVLIAHCCNLEGGS